MMGHRNRKRGFTLVETVVSVGIVAALAAVVYPVVTRQFDSADPTRIQNDLSNIAIGIETFNVNNKLLPGDLDDLANKITTSDSTLTNATAGLPVFSTTGLWIGPYITASVVESATPEATISTGFGALIQDSFVCYRADNNEHGVSDATSGAANAADDVACPTLVTTAPYFLAIQITGVTCSTAAGSTYMRINALFDGANEVAPSTAGRIRCETAAFTGSKDTNVDVVYFLAVPIT